jgi:hypothetical protein
MARCGFVVTAKSRYRTAFGVVLASSALLRMHSALGDLWLDEIWSLEVTRQLSSIAGILAWHHDNNHLLNSIYLFICGPSRTPMIYRALSIAAGVAFQFVFWRWPLWRSNRERLLGAALAGSSYLLVLYSSEARGYSLMLLFEALSVWLAWSWLERRADWKRLLLALCVLLGLCAHATFGLFYAALFMATISPERMRLHRPALAASALYAVVFLSGMVVGGGNPEPWFRALAQFLLYAAGFPQSPLLAGFVMTFLVAELARMRRDNPPLFRQCSWTLALPVVAAALLRAEFMHPRYFLPMLPFLLLLSARAIETGLRAHGVRALFATTLGMAVTVGQYGSLRQLQTAGRGQYRAAMQFMDEHTTTPIASIGSDHDFRNCMLVDYYGRGVGRVKLRYITQDRLATSPAAWIILHSAGPVAPSRRVYSGSLQYDLMRFYPSAPLSGFSWSLYRMRTNTAARGSW